MSAEFFSFSNPVFSNFAFYAGVVLCKTMLMSGLTALHRIKNEVCVYIVLVLILTRTRNDATRCIQVLFMKRKTYDLRGLRFLQVNSSVRCCIPQHVEITHKQG
jgi:hypothetical protein